MRTKILAGVLALVATGAFASAISSGGSGGTSQGGIAPVSVAFESDTISAHSCNPQTISVPGAALHDFAGVTADFALPVGVILSGGRVTAANVVEINLCNVTDDVAAPDPGIYIVKLAR